MDLRDVAYFEVIAETSNLGRAAERLGRTKPALTKCIRRLEAGLGAQLFKRVGRGIELTATGRMLLSRAGAMRSRLAELEREVKEFAAGSVGHVRIGAGAVSAESVLPPVLRGFLAEVPGVTLEIVLGMGDVLRRQLRRGEIDIIVSSVSWEQDDEFLVHVLGADEVSVVASLDHELFKRPVRLGDLAGHKWILPSEGVANRQFLSRVFASHGLRGPEVQIVASSLQSLPNLIAETNLLSFISTRALSATKGNALRCLHLPETTLKRKLGFIVCRDSSLTPAVLRFIEKLKETPTATWLPPRNET